MLKGKIIKIDNLNRLEYLNDICTLHFAENGSKGFIFNILEGYKPNRTIITSDVEEIIVKTRNTTYTIEIIDE